MSLLTRNVGIRQFSLLCRHISTSHNQYSAYTYDDFKPGPYPRTQAEREAAAKKYNLHPLEYEPYPEDSDEAKGDYPKLPDIAVETKDENYAWDYPALRRNFGDPVHQRIDLLGHDRVNVSLRPRYSVKVMLSSFFGILIFSYGMYFLLEPYPMFRSALKKQYPQPGVVHYSFETDDSVKLL